jgi:hypothetical protein
VIDVPSLVTGVVSSFVSVLVSSVLDDPPHAARTVSDVAASSAPSDRRVRRVITDDLTMTLPGVRYT